MCFFRCSPPGAQLRGQRIIFGALAASGSASCSASRGCIWRMSASEFRSAALAFLTNAYFGQAVLGQLNIALRIVDPLRMA